MPVTWATHVDPETGRPVETENARYQVSNPLVDLPLEEQIDVLKGMSAGEIEAAYHKPGPLGGHNWHLCRLVRHRICIHSCLGYAVWLWK